MTNFETNTLHSKIQGLSIQAGEVFADLYASADASNEDVDNALEAYKSLRRLLPRTSYGRHIGHKAAHKSTDQRIKYVAARSED